MKKIVSHNLLLFLLCALPLVALSQQNITQSAAQVPAVQRVVVDMFSGNLPDRLDLGRTYNLNFTINKGELASYGALVLPKDDVLRYTNFRIPAGGRIYEYPNAIFIVWSPLPQQVNRFDISVSMSVLKTGNLSSSLELGIYFMFFKDGKVGRAGVYKNYELFTSSKSNKQFYVVVR